ncbi:MAG: winged helix-turn-helix domain-containing protein [Chloroflexi bacterium]|nr:winged helix-turn-helix domain-containing protein [Chloroflexota bacterium]
MKDNNTTINQEMNGDELLATLSALASVHRLRIVALLTAGRIHVSQLAREMQMSRPLVHMHLQRLEAAGLVKGELELSEDGKAMKYFEVAPFMLSVSPASIVEAIQTLTTESGETGDVAQVQQRVAQEMERVAGELSQLQERAGAMKRMFKSPDSKKE